MPSEGKSQRRRRRTLQKEKKRRKKKGRHDRRREADDAELFAEFGVSAEEVAEAGVRGGGTTSFSVLSYASEGGGAKRRRVEGTAERGESSAAAASQPVHSVSFVAAEEEEEEEQDGSDSDSDAGGLGSFITLQPTSVQKATMSRSAGIELASQRRRAAAAAAPPWAWCAAPRLQGDDAMTDALRGRYAGRTVGLHAEILDFCALVSPTAAELSQRSAVVATLREIITHLWPDARLIVFGSTATGLCLPDSDIDCVVMGYPGCTWRDPSKGSDAEDDDDGDDDDDEEEEESRAPPSRKEKQATAGHLRALGAELRKRGCVSYLEVITSARIPIVKMKDKGSGIPVDICFGQASGIRTARFTKQLIQKWAPLKPLVVLLKNFIYQRGMAETYRGGVGSYLLMLMVLGYLQYANRASERARAATPLPAKRQRRERDDSSDEEEEEEKVPPQWRSLSSLGELLLGFLRFYGTTLNYVEVGISVRGAGGFFSKRKRGGWFNAERPSLLAVENPDVIDADVGRNSFEMARVRRSFTHAFEVLMVVSSAQSEEEQRRLMSLMGESSAATLLGLIVAPDEAMVKRRAALAEVQLHAW